MKTKSSGKVAICETLQNTFFFLKIGLTTAFYDRDHSDVMISGGALSSSKVAQCSCHAWLPRF